MSQGSLYKAFGEGFVIDSKDGFIIMNFEKRAENRSSIRCIRKKGLMSS